MGRVSGYSNDSGFNGESLSEDAKIKTEHGNEDSEEEGSLRKREIKDHLMFKISEGALKARNVRKKRSIAQSGRENSTHS